MVSVVAFNSVDPITNPAEAYNFFCKMLEMNENKHKGGGVGPFLNI